jgi:hypothetical protein
MRTLSTIAIAAALLICAGRTATAQIVFGTNNIDFGRVVRGTNKPVSYLSGDAAEFWVLGTKGRNVRLTVNAPHLTRTGATLALSVVNADCAYSLDGGVTWTTFSTGTLIQNTLIPNSGFGLLLVRVGGTATPTISQTRGTYNGNITLTAVYR